MDKNYWENFYKQQNEKLEPSLFAKYVLENLAKRGHALVELGCGNGRDAIFFASEGLNVKAIDQCQHEISVLNAKYKNSRNLIFHADDFTSLSDIDLVDIIYSRFTIHSISKEQEQRTLEWTYRNSKTGGYFCIEVRGQKNEIYKLGEQVKGETDAFIYNGHYRRFINFDDLCQSLEQIGFTIFFAAEQKGFAPFEGKDETYVRIIAQKV
jgi:tellurite methyltransferase